MSGASLRWLGALAAASTAALPLVWTYVLHDYQRERLTSFLDPAPDPLGAGFQLLTAQRAVARVASSGRASPTVPKTSRPAARPDDGLVSAVVAEEVGSSGASWSSCCSPR